MDKLEPLFKQIRRLGGPAYKYRYILGSLTVLAVFSFIVMRIDTLAGSDINEERYNQRILEIDSVVFDVEAISVINQLRANDIEVRENIDQGRINPF